MKTGVNTFIYILKEVNFAIKLIKNPVVFID